MIKMLEIVYLMQAFLILKIQKHLQTLMIKQLDKKGTIQFVVNSQVMKILKLKVIMITRTSLLDKKEIETNYIKTLTNIIMEPKMLTEKKI